MNDVPAALVERFWARVACGTTAECWPWLGGRNSDGYGSFWVGKKNVRAHRFAYEVLRGPIPVGMVLDHLCRVRHCVNPAHLEVVTLIENIRRGQAGWHMRSKLPTHCPQGHEYSDENTMWLSDGSRRCRKCNREQCARYSARRRGAGATQ